MDYKEIQVLKQSEKSTVLLVRESEGEQLLVRKALKEQCPIYSELLNCPHPYLPKLYDVEISDNGTTIFEEYIEGQSLGKAELSERQLCNAVKELCSVLGFLHGKGIIHRDIKPSNIILAKDGHIRLIDFDAARMTKGDAEQDTTLLGTRGYAPPEQYGFAQTDSRTDIYSLGMTFRQLLGEKADTFLYRRIIKKCTNLNPNNRYQSVMRVKKALDYTKRSILFSATVLLLAAALWFFVFIPRQPMQNEEPQTPSAEIAVLPAPANPHWNGETGIALWGTVLQSGTGGSQAYSWRLYRKDTASPPDPEETGWIMRGNMWGTFPSIGSLYAVNIAKELQGNGFYYFTVSAEGDGVNYLNSPFVVSDAFEYTGESAPRLPNPAGLTWKSFEEPDGVHYFAICDNLDDYAATDSLNVEVYNQSGDYIGRNIGEKEKMMSYRGGEVMGIQITDNILMEAGGSYRFIIQAVTSRANEYRSSLLPDPIPEEYYSPWLTLESP